MEEGGEGGSCLRVLEELVFKCGLAASEKRTKRCGLPDASVPRCAVKAPLPRRLALRWSWWCSLPSSWCSLPPALVRTDTLLFPRCVSCGGRDASVLAEALGDMSLCYVLDGILVFYGVVLTILYCRLRVRPSFTC